MRLKLKHQQIVFYYLFCMITGFEKIVEERIRRAFENGEFDDLSGAGEPLALEDDSCVPEELRLAYKILKNAECLPPEIELRKEIEKTEDLLAALPDTAEKYRILKKLNFLIFKVNTVRRASIANEIPEHYAAQVVSRLEMGKQRK
jgi:hypothetical protein